MIRWIKTSKERLIDVLNPFITTQTTQKIKEAQTNEPYFSGQDQVSSHGSVVPENFAQEMLPMRTLRDYFQSPRDCPFCVIFPHNAIGVLVRPQMIQLLP